jgi:tetratricopeptide (TPR) repeat protein
MSKQHQLLLDKARRSNDAEAIKIYKQVIAEAPSNDEAHYNLGLIYKRQHDWENCFHHNQLSALLDPNFPPAWWNMGVAATVLKKWRAARKAWGHFGLKYPDSDEEITGQIGITPIRTNPKGQAEVLWCKRIDPVRARIENVPTIGSGRHYDDILLNDGQPNGSRIVEGRKFDVLDEILVLQKSDYLTFEITMEGSNPAEMKEFKRICEGYAVECENWTANTRILCKQCSEGTPHTHHDHKLKPEDGVFHFGLAGKNRPQIEQVLESWMMKTLNKEIKIVNVG